MLALPEAPVAAVVGLGSGFCSGLLAWPGLLPGLPAKGPFLLGLVCSWLSSVCGVLFSPGDYVNTIDWFVLNSPGCWVIITRC